MRSSMWSRGADCGPPPPPERKEFKESGHYKPIYSGAGDRRSPAKPAHSAGEASGPCLPFGKDTEMGPAGSSPGTCSRKKGFARQAPAINFATPNVKSCA